MATARPSRTVACAADDHDACPGNVRLPAPDDRCACPCHEVRTYRMNGNWDVHDQHGRYLRTDYVS